MKSKLSAFVAVLYGIGALGYVVLMVNIVLADLALIFPDLPWWRL